MRSVRLGDIVEIQLGKMLSPASKTGLRPMPYLRNANVQWDRFDLSDVYEMDFDPREERKFLLQRGDVLVCEGGEPGRAAVWTGAIDHCLYQKALHRLRPINGAVDPQFLVYRLWLGAYRGEFLADQTQSTIAHLPAIRLAELKLKLPPLGDQRRIVAKIKDQFGAMQLAKEAAQARLKAATDLWERLVDQLVDTLRNDFGNGRLGPLIDETRNGLYKPDSYYGDGTPILKMFNIDSRGTWKLARLDRLRLSRVESVTYRLEEGDLLVNRVNSRELVGKLAVVDSGTAGMVFESKNIRLRLDPSRLDPWFAALMLRSSYCRHQILGSAKQIVGMATISRSSIDSVSLPVPPLARQRSISQQFHERIETLNAVEGSNRVAQQAIDALLPTLLGRAFADLTT
jgi:type I restriction enzyme S subunit